MAKILHLETATKVCSVAVSENGTLIEMKETDESGYTHGENLTLFIEDVLTEANLTLSDMDAISITSGPGSYTGLRIGAATAKGLCYALNLPLIAIDSLSALAASARSKYKGANLCPMIDARRMEVYNQVFNEHFEPLKELSADVLDQDSYNDFEPFIYFGDGADKMQELWSNRDVTYDKTIRSSSSGHVSIAFEKFKNEEFEDVAYWEPFYLKDFIVQKPKK
jgi:tRNA threonylcarbamoyladenosine biosynthesis protein TsaB